MIRIAMLVAALLGCSAALAFAENPARPYPITEERVSCTAFQPYDTDGNSLRTVAIDRPLDFAVVTDHAEQLGETQIQVERRKAVPLGGGNHGLNQGDRL
ncbi:MAG: DUF3604 domain-containing protein [Myxococcales bacterium]|nr:DUF3604 domain-containing protein [Myxococcales bacterium]